MSTAGRLQDALHDLLIGHGEGYGSFVPGKLYDLEHARVSALIDDIVDVVYPFTAPRLPVVCQADLCHQRPGHDGPHDNEKLDAAHPLRKP